MRSIRSSSPKHFSYNRRINGLIGLEERNSCGEVELRSRHFQESQAKDCQEIEELRRICCEDADRARIDELSLHQARKPMIVSQLLAQVQDLQNKVNSLPVAREFHDPETASSSGSSHVHSQPSTIPSPRGMLGLDSGLPLDTRNILVYLARTSSNIQRSWHHLLED